MKQVRLRACTCEQCRTETCWSNRGLALSLSPCALAPEQEVAARTLATQAGSLLTACALAPAQLLWPTLC